MDSKDDRVKKNPDLKEVIREQEKRIAELEMLKDHPHPRELRLETEIQSLKLECAEKNEALEKVIERQEVVCGKSNDGHVFSETWNIAKLALTTTGKEVLEELKYLRERMKSTHCAYCDFHVPLDADASVISEHIRTCEKQPIREYEKQITDLKADNERFERMAKDLTFDLTKAEDELASLRSKLAEYHNAYEGKKHEIIFLQEKLEKAKDGLRNASEKGSLAVREAMKEFGYDSLRFADVRHGWLETKIPIDETLKDIE